MSPECRKMGSLKSKFLRGRGHCRRTSLAKEGAPLVRWGSTPVQVCVPRTEILQAPMRFYCGSMLVRRHPPFTWSMLATRGTQSPCSVEEGGGQISTSLTCKRASNRGHRRATGTDTTHRTYTPKRRGGIAYRNRHCVGATLIGAVTSPGGAFQNRLPIWPIHRHRS